MKEGGGRRREEMSSVLSSKMTRGDKVRGPKVS